MILTDRQPFADEDRAILISYKAVVDGVSALIGEHCEIVLHSLEDIEHSAICIANGHNTNRQVGSPITDLALKSLRNMQSESVSKPYFTRAKGNVLMKSVTIAFEIANNVLLVYFVSILIWMCRFLNLCRRLCQRRNKMKPLPSILQVQWKNWWLKR